MKTQLAVVGVALSSLLGACTGDSPVEDGQNDEFLTEDAKADAFGVEDWSPDGAAVLKVVSNFSKTKLEDEVGLSARVAKSIVTHRATLTGGEYHDLAELDAAGYVGVTVFKRLLRYAADEKLFKTAIRIPLVVEGDNNNVSITSYNTKAHSVGLTGFARYTFVDRVAREAGEADGVGLRVVRSDRNVVVVAFDDERDPDRGLEQLLVRGVAQQALEHGDADVAGCVELREIVILATGQGRAMGDDRLRDARRQADLVL